MDSIETLAEEILKRGECGESAWSDEYRQEFKAFIIAKLTEIRDDGYYSAWWP